MVEVEEGTLVEVSFLSFLLSFSKSRVEFNGNYILLSSPMCFICRHVMDGIWRGTETKGRHVDRVSKDSPNSLYCIVSRPVYCQRRIYRREGPTPTSCALLLGVKNIFHYVPLLKD